MATPDWSGSLRLPGDDYRFQDGAPRLALSRPEDALELDLVPIRPEFEIRGRVVFAGKPMPGGTGFENRKLEHVTVPREGATVEVRLAHDWSSW